MKNTLGKTISQSKTMVQYDENAKRVVANKNILAEILAEFWKYDKCE